MELRQPSLREAVETVGAAVALYDRDDRLAEFNNRYREWRACIGGTVSLGVAWKHLIRDSVLCGAIPEAKGREKQWLLERHAARGSYSIVRTIADGRSFKVDERRLSSGGIAVIWTDITDILQAHQERQTVQAAELAHDFNNALTAISGNLSFLQRHLSVDDSKARQRLDSALVAVRSGAAIARRQFQHLRRPSASPGLTDVGLAVANVLKILGGAVRSSIELSCHAPLGIFFAATDPTELEAAIVNLVINARDAIQEEGRVEISVARKMADVEETETSDKEYVVVSVTDTGIGMNEATLARATDLLFTTKEHGEGSGLGLSSVKRFCAMAGGRLLIQSSPDLGTSVEVWLPCAAPIAPIRLLIPDPPSASPASLLDCPFCGARTAKSWEKPNGQFTVMCMTCPATMTAKSRQHVERAWNRRVGGKDSAGVD